jgi:hypothetical protein
LRIQKSNSSGALVVLKRCGLENVFFSLSCVYVPVSSLHCLRNQIVGDKLSNVPISVRSNIYHQVIISHDAGFCLYQGLLGGWGRVSSARFHMTLISRCPKVMCNLSRMRSSLVRMRSIVRMRSSLERMRSSLVADEI